MNPETSIFLTVWRCGVATLLRSLCFGRSASSGTLVSTTYCQIFSESLRSHIFDALLSVFRQTHRFSSRIEFPSSTLAHFSGSSPICVGRTDFQQKKANAFRRGSPLNHHGPVRDRTALLHLLTC